MTPDANAGAAALGSFREARTELLAGDRQGVAFCGAMSEQVDAVLVGLAASLPPGFSLAAVAGYGRAELCPFSDVDVLLLHDRRAARATVEQTAKALWYPLWDAGLKVSPATHSLDSAIDLARTDLVTATTFLSVRHLAGDAQQTAMLAERAQRSWQEKAGKKWLPELVANVSARQAKAGEVAFLLEPDLKEGRGGLRDVHAAAWALQSGHDAAQGSWFSETPPLRSAYETILTVRAQLHRSARRAGDRLLLQEQDGVAAGLGYDGADALMAAVSSAARQIAWETDELWRHVSDRLGRRSVRRRFKGNVRLTADCVLIDGQVELAPDADPEHDPELILRVGAASALAGALPSRAALRRMAGGDRQLSEPWREDTRRALVTLLGTGPTSLAVFEALDQERLFERVVPEWTAVRCHPQRNAFHVFTVDRHLWQTAINASALVRRVARPDLLLVAALFHDIGKGYPGDHTEVGLALVRTIGARMGFPPADVDVLVGLVEHHLLLPETATRRDISDEGTIAMVANAVVDADRLALLYALVQADSLATGPTAWSDWKAGLVDELVRRVDSVLAGHRPAAVSGIPAAHHLEMIEQVRKSGRALLYGSRDACTVAAPDRTGLFCTVAGVLSMHSVDVLSADVWTGDDGVALEEYRVSRRLGGETDWKKVEADLRRALAGEVDLDAKLAEKVKAYASVRKAQMATAATPPRAEVLVDNTTSADATIVEVRSPDGIGVLYRVTSVLAGFGADIRHAKIATLGHEVVDAFYVRRLEELDGAKVGRKFRDDESAELQQGLLAVLDAPV